MLQKVISGGQTGADRAGLIAAKANRLETGGYIPKGFKTELGSEPQLGTLYGLTEFGTTYPQRTLANVKTADATWIFYRGKLERGSLLTKNYCDKLIKRCMTLDLDYIPQHKNPESTIDYLVFWLNRVQPKILNIAGNRESVAPGIQKQVFDILVDVFRKQL